MERGLTPILMACPSLEYQVQTTSKLKKKKKKSSVYLLSGSNIYFFANRAVFTFPKYFTVESLKAWCLVACSDLFFLNSSRNKDF